MLLNFSVGIPSFTKYIGHDGSTASHHKVKCVEGWTPWMSVNTPTSTNPNDIETSKGLRRAYSFCDEGQQTAIECKPVGTGGVRPSPSPPPYADYQCDLEKGLRCISQNNTQCPNYEIRFACNCRK